jgi:hypothetical protein
LRTSGPKTMLSSTCGRQPGMGSSLCRCYSHGGGGRLLCKRERPNEPLGSDPTTPLLIVPRVGAFASI